MNLQLLTITMLLTFVLLATATWYVALTSCMLPSSARASWPTACRR
jgi:hypothetical protein